MQRAQPGQLLLGCFVALANALLCLDALLLSPSTSLLANLLGLTPDVGEHSVGLVPRGGGLLGDLALALVELNFALGCLLLKGGGSRNERLLHLVAVGLGVLAGPLEQRGRLTGGAVAHLGRFLLGGAKQLLHPVSEALRGAPLAAFGQFSGLLLELGLGVSQLPLDPVRATALALVRLLRFRECGMQGSHVLVDLLAVVAASSEVEHICLYWLRG